MFATWERLAFVSQSFETNQTNGRKILKNRWIPLPLESFEVLFTLPSFLAKGVPSCPKNQSFRHSLSLLHFLWVVHTLLYNTPFQVQLFLSHCTFFPQIKTNYIGDIKFLGIINLKTRRLKISIWSQQMKENQSTFHNEGCLKRSKLQK